MNIGFVFVRKTRFLKLNYIQIDTASSEVAVPHGQSTLTWDNCMVIYFPSSHQRHCTTTPIAEAPANVHGSHRTLLWGSEGFCGTTLGFLIQGRKAGKKFNKQMNKQKNKQTNKQKPLDVRTVHTSACPEDLWGISTFMEPWIHDIKDT